jgi:pimeloyl-ACP methyl ester carboxylesterase
MLSLENCTAVFRCLCEHLSSLLPNARRRMIHGASHIVHEAASDAFNEAVMEFLGAQ